MIFVSSYLLHFKSHENLSFYSTIFSEFSLGTDHELTQHLQDHGKGGLHCQDFSLFQTISLTFLFPSINFNRNNYNCYYDKYSYNYVETSQ